MAYINEIKCLSNYWLLLQNLAIFLCFCWFSDSGLTNYLWSCSIATMLVPQRPIFSIILIKTTYLRISLVRHNFYHQNISHTCSIHNYFDHTRTGCPKSHAPSLNIHIAHCINCIVTNLDKWKEGPLRIPNLASSMIN